MARKSRKPSIVNEVIVEEKLSTALYLRLSVKNDESDSIENQEKLIRHFLSDKPEFTIHGIYCDYGKSGVTFHRPDFQRLQADINKGVINCIIVKDLSRFGRNSLDGGEFLETVFTNQKVRFIAVNDNYDSFSATAADQQMMHLTNLANELYAKDISAKISSSFRVKQENGEFLGAYPTFGYMKNAENPRKLDVDPEAASVVKKIFQMKREGIGNNVIARQLNEEDIPSPSRYRYEKGIVRNEKFKDTKWAVSVVKKILTNEVLLGHTIQGQKKQSLAENKKQVIVPKEQWIIVKNTHQPIISQELFDEVQEILKERSQLTQMTNSTHKQENLFKGMLICQECGSILQMQRIKWYSKKKNSTQYAMCYHCPTHINSAQRCSFTSIPEKNIREAVLCVLQKQKALANDFRALFEDSKYIEEKKRISDEFQSQLAHVKQEQHRVEKLRQRVYDDYIEEVIDKSEYNFLFEKYNKQLLQLSEQYCDIEKRKKESTEKQPEKNKWLLKTKLFQDEMELTHELLYTLVEKINIIDKQTLHIDLHFRDEYTALCKCVQQGGA